MNEIDYERLLQRCLDERRDPLDDAALVAFAAEDASRIERLATLRERLSTLPALVAPSGRSAPRRSWRWWTVAGVLSAAAGVLAALSLREIVGPGPVAPPGPALRGAIVSAELQEIRPWARSTAQFTVREVLASGAGVQFEVFDQRSAVR